VDHLKQHTGQAISADQAHKINGITSVALLSSRGILATLPAHQWSTFASAGGWIALLLVAVLVAGATTSALLQTRPWASRNLRETALDYSMGLAALACVVAGVVHRGVADDRGSFDASPWSLTGVLVATTCAAVVVVAVRRKLGQPLAGSTAAIPGPSLAALGVSWAIPWTVAAGTGVYGALVQETAVLVVALAAVSWIGLAGMMRAIAALRTIRAYYLELDEALFWRERAQDAAERPFLRQKR
jgi:hypothetical protein